MLALVRTGHASAWRTLALARGRVERETVAFVCHDEMVWRVCVLEDGGYGWDGLEGMDGVEVELEEIPGESPTLESWEHHVSVRWKGSFYKTTTSHVT